MSHERGINVYCVPRHLARHSRRTLLELMLALGHEKDRLLIEEEEFGKPQFPRLSGVHVSVSHSGGWWLCAVGGDPVGVDVQLHRATDAQGIARRFFHPRERAYLEQHGYGRFFDVWSGKESWIKYTGKGLHAGLEEFSVVSPEGWFPRIEGAELQMLPFFPAYSLCLCTEGPVSARLVGYHPGAPTPFVPMEIK